MDIEAKGQQQAKNLTVTAISKKNVQLTFKIKFKQSRDCVGKTLGP